MELTVGLVKTGPARLPQLFLQLRGDLCFRLKRLGRRPTLAIGPEGGFIQKEIDSLTAIGFRAVSFGPRILRVETAVSALIGRMV